MKEVLVLSFWELVFAPHQRTTIPFQAPVAVNPEISHHTFTTKDRQVIWVFPYLMTTFPVFTLDFFIKWKQKGVVVFSALELVLWILNLEASVPTEPVPFTTFDEDKKIAVSIALAVVVVGAVTICSRRIDHWQIFEFEALRKPPLEEVDVVFSKNLRIEII